MVTLEFVILYVGGGDGKRGVNTLVSADGKETVLPGKTTADMKAGVCNLLYLSVDG